MEVIDSPGSIEEMERREQQEVVQDALNHLTQTKRQLVLSIKMDGKSTTSVAKEIDLPIWTVQRLLNEALHELKDHLVSDGSIWHTR